MVCKSPRVASAKFPGSEPTAKVQLVDKAVSGKIFKIKNYRVVDAGMTVSLEAPTKRLT